MVRGFNWDKVNKTKLSTSKGSYSSQGEKEHNKNLDNYWKKKFKGKYKKFFETWDKENKDK